MAKIIIKNQEEWDALPKAFGEYTVIDIRTGGEWVTLVSVPENSHAVLRENSRAVLRGSSRAEAFESSMVMIFSAYAIVKKLLDYSTAVFKGCKESIEEKSATAHSREIPIEVSPGFDEWLSRGYAYADGVYKKLISQKKIREIEVFEVEEFLENKSSYVVKRGDTFSHGETIEKAIEDLRYKISDRDVSDFEHWRDDLNKEIELDEAIQGYRVITGACEYGVKEFMKGLGELPEKITPKIVLEKTGGAFGNSELREYLG